MNIYKIENLSFRYQNNQEYILKDISFEIEEGGFYLICGKSGSGKTTLLQLLKKEIMPQGYITGNIFINNSTDQPENIGYIFQNPDFQIVSHKVIHELSFGLENMSMSLKEMKRRIGEVVHFFNLQDILYKDISKLSGGQKQLVNLASIVAMKPKVMLLDEPTAQLDPIASQEFLTMLKRVNEELNITVVLVEHDLEQTMKICDCLIYLENGEIQYYGTPRRVPKLKNYEKALPVVTQLFHKSNIEDIVYDFKSVRKWIKDHQDNFTVVNKNEIELQNILLQLKNIHFNYEDIPVLKGLNLDVYENEVLAIVGSNGCGKSTLLKVICGLLNHKRGKIYVDQVEIKKDKNLFDNFIAYLPQDPTTMFLKETVKDELDNQESIDLLYDLKLDFLLEQHPYDLSGGQMQLVAFIKILARNPKLVVLDEPTKGLDAYYKEKIGNLLEKLANKITVIIVSHDLEFCARYAKRIGMMFDGRIESIDKTTTFFSSNLFYTTIMNKLTRGILDNVNIIEDINYE